MLAEESADSSIVLVLRVCDNAAIDRLIAFRVLPLEAGFSQVVGLSGVMGAVFPSGRR
jgi:hypothetical protein